MLVVCAVKYYSLLKLQETFITFNWKTIYTKNPTMEVWRLGTACVGKRRKRVVGGPRPAGERSCCGLDLLNVISRHCASWTCFSCDPAFSSGDQLVKRPLWVCGARAVFREKAFAPLIFFSAKKRGTAIGEFYRLATHITRLFRVESPWHSTLLLYRSPWPYPLLSELPALHGEILMNVKLEDNQTEDAMIKYDQGDLPELKFVDPRIIQPISEDALDAVYNQGQLDSVLIATQEDLNDNLQYSSDYSIRMEQCINLDLFLSPIIGDSAANTADELNTPIFDIPKELNVINIQDNTRNNNPFDFSAEGAKNVVGDERTRVETKTNSRDTSVVNNSDITDSSLLSPNSAYGMADADGINLEEYDLLSDYNDAILLSGVFGAEEAETAQTDAKVGFNEPETPESSACSTDIHALKLDVGRYTGPTVELQTPDVINTICSIEKDFNLFSFGQIIKIEDVLQSADDNSSSIAFSEAPPHAYPEEPEDVSLEYTEQPRKYSRKRKDVSDYENDDDDEDYVPPGKRQKHKRKTTDQQPERIRRGRPSQQQQQRVSVSSDNSESSKYREMRDKNNEASRRSRHKRRIQEQCYEDEREELTMKNTKLKAQVAELERSVSTLRSDMMRLMLMKK